MRWGQLVFGGRFRFGEMEGGGALMGGRWEEGDGRQKAGGWEGNQLRAVA